IPRVSRDRGVPDAGGRDDTAAPVRQKRHLPVHRFPNCVDSTARFEGGSRTGRTHQSSSDRRTAPVTATISDLGYQVIAASGVYVPQDDSRLLIDTLAGSVVVAGRRT